MGIDANVLERLNNNSVRGYLTVKKRIVFKGAVYHVTQRAPGRECVFLEDGDYLYFLKLLKTAASKFQLKIFAFALLPNHIHLLLQITETNLSDAMKNIFEKYAEYFNKKYQRKGHVFCGRFRASLCNDDTYFLAASVYIHLNPLRAGLCQNLKDYRWTSVHLYIDRDRETFIVYEKILSILDEDVQKARQKYSALLTNSMILKGPLLLEPRVIRRFLKEGIEIIKKTLNIPASKEENELDSLICQVRQKERIRKDKDQKTRKYVIEQLFANGYTMLQVQELLGISKATTYRTLRTSL